MHNFLDRLILQQHKGLALLNSCLSTALELERSTRSMCLLMFSGTRKTHRENFTVDQLRFGD